MSEPANPQQESRAPSFPVKFSDHQRKEHAISCEFAFVSRKPIDGVLVIPSSEDSSVWNGIIFIRCGMLAGAMFRFTLTLQPDFPSTSAIPEVIFDLQIFHPHVFHESRRVDFSRHFPDGWRCEQHHIYHILNYIQRLFFSFDAEPTTAANPEAAMLYNTSRKQFQKIAIETIRKSRELIYDLPSGLDHNAIMMTPWDQSVHETYRQALLNPSSSKKDRKKGVSWMSSNGRFMCDMYPSSTTDNTPTDGSSELSLEEKVERLDVAQ
ncbi:hypothetical protein L596_011039 [Steinernema carpocapsae]|nr:hypothetical protein L596_011039 [Steinernema carpocapsae]